MNRHSRHAFRLLAVLVCTAGGARLGAGQDPQTLWKQATLYRDTWGVPHVYAETPQAMAFAFGYAQAEDHLESMLFAYRVANGRAAAIAGEPYAESDAFALRMGHRRLAQRALETAEPVTAALCTGFAMGVNAWLLEHPGQAPPWAEGVQPQDVLALWHAYVTSMAPFDLPEVYRRRRAADTGNAWALAPDRTEEGAATLVINPHQYHEGPFRWYEAHLAAGDYEMRGATLFGLPVILQGHNGVLGWALTPNEPDFADVFEESLEGPQRDPKDPRITSAIEEKAPLLWYYSQAQPYYVRTAAGLEERYTPSLIRSRGPVFEKDGGLYSWRIGGFRDFEGLLQLVEMGRAQSLEDFQAAVQLQQLPCFHIVYADRAGDLFYLYNARTSDRLLPQDIRDQAPPLDPAQRAWKAPLPAAFEAFAWQNIVPLNQLPYVLNPEAGYVQACGNPPWQATDKPPFGPETWPAWFVGDADTYRAQRVRQLLRSGKRTFRDNQSMLYDTVIPAARPMTQLLLDVVENNSARIEAAHPDLKTGLQLLEDWNYLADKDSPGMTFYHVWWAMLQAQTNRSQVSQRALYRALEQRNPLLVEAAVTAAEDAARMMRNDFDAISIPWGEVHRITRGERDEAIGGAGSGQPVFVASDFEYQDGRWLATYGYGFAMVVQFTDPPRAVSLVPFGASEDPESPHFDDQLDLMLEKRFKQAPFERETVWRYAVSATGRRVALMPQGAEAQLTLHAPQRIVARLDTAAEAPQSPPAGQAAFTLFVTPAVNPEDAKVETTVEFYIPAVLCKKRNLSALQLYGLDEEEGWRPVAQQRLDRAARVLWGEDTGARTYAVFGPEPVLERPAREGEPLPAPPGLPAPEEAPPADEDSTFHIEFTGAPEVPAAEEAPEAAPLMEGPTGERTFFIERVNPETAPSDAPPEPAAVEGEGPSGRRQFKIERASPGAAMTPEGEE